MNGNTPKASTSCFTSPNKRSLNTATHASAKITIRIYELHYSSTPHPHDRGQGQHERCDQQNPHGITQPVDQPCSATTAFPVARIFTSCPQNFPPAARLYSSCYSNHPKQDSGSARANGGLWIALMVSMNVEKLGELSVVECEGRIVRSDAAFALRYSITCQVDARVIVLDLSEVNALEGGGLGMLMFLQRWARDHHIQLKIFNPRGLVRARLERTESAASKIYVWKI